ncbi:Ycf68 protein [Spatholobus suberectus]|nr:Ycf68 protein [Spatholobus suberectus]
MDETKNYDFARAATCLHKSIIASNHLLAMQWRICFSSLVHTACHVIGAGHAQSRYLNYKEGDAEDKTIDWSEVITR